MCFFYLKKEEKYRGALVCIWVWVQIQLQFFLDGKAL